MKKLFNIVWGNWWAISTTIEIATFIIAVIAVILLYYRTKGQDKILVNQDKTLKIQDKTLKATQFKNAVDMLTNKVLAVALNGANILYSDYYNQPENSHYKKQVEDIFANYLKTKFYDDTTPQEKEHFLAVRDKIISDLQKNKTLHTIDLHKANLQKAVLREAKLQNADLYNAKLQNANLQNAKLQKANLQKANLQKANLQKAKLQNAKLQKANLQEAELQNAKLQKANLQFADLQNANLQNAKLQNANLQEAELQNAKLQKANLQFAKLQEAELQNAKLQNAKLQNAELQEAELQNAKLQNAKLQNANLQNAELQFANLQEAELRNAKLQKANLQFADLQNANLQFANLQYADLQYADLRRTVFFQHSNENLIKEKGSPDTREREKQKILFIKEKLSKTSSHHNKTANKVIDDFRLFGGAKIHSANFSYAQVDDSLLLYVYLYMIVEHHTNTYISNNATMDQQIEQTNKLDDDQKTRLKKLLKEHDLT